MCTPKMRALSYIGAEKFTFPPKPDRHTYRRTDISVYGVALHLSILTKIVPGSFGSFLVHSDIGSIQFGIIQVLQGSLHAISVTEFNKTENKKYITLKSLKLQYRFLIFR